MKLNPSYLQIPDQQFDFQTFIHSDLGVSNGNAIILQGNSDSQRNNHEAAEV